jgi:cytochrome c oxidase accessory protein FixG
MVFRKIEYWIEGDAGEQRRLNASTWNAEKTRKKVLKHVIFYAISFIIANWFLAYIIGMNKVKQIVTEPLSQHTSGFISMLIFSGLFYGVFAFLREQVCVAICPYGRMQGVLLVKESIVVAYDFVRGEPRGRIKKAKPDEPAYPLKVVAATTPQEKPLGDCIDCKLCVHVCPTGIDIRNGTQLECVNCTACIDACDEIMDKISRPRGLIRYDSITGIESGHKKIFTPRVWAYSGVLCLLLLADIVLLSRRGDVEAMIMRTPGMLSQVVDSTHLSNLYKFDLINKTTVDYPFELKVSDGLGTIRPVGTMPQVIPAEKSITGAFFIDMETAKLHDRKNSIIIHIISNGKVVDEVKTTFFK